MTKKLSVHICNDHHKFAACLHHALVGAANVSTVHFVL